MNYPYADGYRIAVCVRSDHHTFPCDTVTVVRYRSDILVQYVLPFFAAMGPDSISMNDNLLIHRAPLSANI